MGKNSPSEVDKNTDFYNYMFDMRQNVDAADAIVILLEGKPAYIEAGRSRDFCISYVIKLLEKYCRSEDDYEFALAAYGFLEGFIYSDYKSCDERATVYWQYTHKYKTHEFIRASWGIQSVPGILRKRHKKIIRYLDKVTSQIKAENNGKLGLIEEVPKKLEFPKPRKIEEVTSILDNDVSHMSPDNEPECNQPEDESEIKSESGVLENPPLEEMDMQIEQSLEGQGASDEETAFQENGKNLEVLPRQFGMPDVDIEPLVPIPSIAMWEKIKKKIAGYLNKPVKRKEIAGASISVLMAVAFMSAIQFFKNMKYPQPPAETASNITIAENDPLTITDITIHNAEITLAPDRTWEKLKVTIYPREANIDDVNYYSDNVHLVTVNRNKEIVELASGWREETEQSTKVHVQFGEIDAIAFVIVEERPIADSAIASGESSMDDNAPNNADSVYGY